MLPPTIYVDLPRDVHAVILDNGTCVFSAQRLLIEPLVLHIPDHVDPAAVLTAALGLGL